jgi:WD domain, G-beta repeat
LVVNRSIAIFMGVLVLVLGAVFIFTRVRPEPLAQTDQQVQDEAFTYVRKNDVPDQPVREQPVAEQPVAEIPVVSGQGAVTAGSGESLLVESGIQTETNREATQSATPDERPDPPVEEVREPVAETVQESDNAIVTELVEPAADMSLKRSYVSLAKDVATQSIEIARDPSLQGLLAYQAYKINSENQGDYYDRDIYQGLYASLKKLISPAYNIYPNLRSSIKDVEWLSRTGSILTVSSDGSAKILSGNFADRASQITLPGTGLNNECLAVSPDEKRAVVGTNGGGLLLLELENQGKVVHQDTDNGKIVLFLKNLGNSGSFVSAGTENRILKWNYDTFEASELTTTASRLSALSATNDGRKVTFGTRDGKLMEFNVASPGEMKTLSEFGRNHVRAIAYAPRAKNMVVGLVDGSLRVLSSGGRVVAKLGGPGARVTDIAFSPDGRFLVAASHDGNVYLWNTSDWSNPPIEFNENNGFVLAVCFSKDGQHFYSGSVDYPRFIGRPTESSQMAGQFCSLLNRNLTREEWVQFFGSEIPYEKTCPGLN